LFESDAAMLTKEQTTAFRLLGVKPGDDPATIRRAWRDLVRTYHPDSYRGDKAAAGARLAELNAAFDVISTFDFAAASAARKQTDAHRAAQQRAAEARGERERGEAAANAKREAARRRAADDRSAPRSNRQEKPRAKPAGTGGPSTGGPQSAPRRPAHLSREDARAAAKAAAGFASAQRILARATRANCLGRTLGYA